MATTTTHALPTPGIVRHVHRCGCALVATDVYLSDEAMRHGIADDPHLLEATTVMPCATHRKPWETMGWQPEDAYVQAAPVHPDWEQRLLASLR